MAEKPHVSRCMSSCACICVYAMSDACKMHSYMREGKTGDRCPHGDLAAWRCPHARLLLVLTALRGNVHAHTKAPTPPRWNIHNTYIHTYIHTYVCVYVHIYYAHILCHLYVKYTHTYKYQHGFQDGEESMAWHPLHEPSDNGTPPEQCRVVGSVQVVAIVSRLR